MTDTPITEFGIRAALDKARTKLARQRTAVLATEAEISMYEKSLELSKPKK